MASMPESVERRVAFGKSQGFPRPIELRFRVDCEEEFTQTWRFWFGIKVLKFALRVIGWRSDLFIWDCRKNTRGFCPCWNSAIAVEEPKFIEKVEGWPHG